MKIINVFEKRCVNGTPESSETFVDEFIGRFGMDGRDGADGTDGTPGLDGRNGVDGVDGREGPEGKNAYQSALEGGFTGTESEFYIQLASIGNISEVLDGINGEEI